MPWIKNENGVEEYKLSIYTKEELPTWDEVYQEFYEKFGATFYDPENASQNIPDPYWKIPRYKYLIAVVCNQFNKMIWEDGYNDKLMELVKRVDGDFVAIRFILSSNKTISYNMMKIINHQSIDSQPIIYTIPFPDGRPNPFIINKDPSIRYDITKDEGSLYLLPIAYYKDGMVTGMISYDLENMTPEISDKDEVYHSIIDLMMQPYASYFENSVGWKE